MFFTGFIFGLTYFAQILTTAINGPTEYTLDVYTVDQAGHRHPEFHGIYKTQKGAEKALFRRYPEGGWCERG